MSDVYMPLVKGLAPLSENTTPALLEEWVPCGSQHVEDGTCACGKRHLTTEYIIYNTRTGEYAEVGSECIKRFHTDVMDLTYRIQRWLDGKVKTLPVSVLDRAYTKWKAINAWEYNFYNSWRFSTKHPKVNRKKAIIEAKVRNAITKRGFKPKPVK